MIPYVYDDGGRAEAGFRGVTGDCGVRAVAIACGLPYRQVYDDLDAFARATERRRRTPSRSRTGIWNATMRRYMARQYPEVVWVPTSFIGQGCRVHLAAAELPSGRLVLSLAHHYAAVIDGVLRDAFDCSREGNRCVYGFWMVGPMGWADGSSR